MSRFSARRLSIVVVSIIAGVVLTGCGKETMGAIDAKFKKLNPGLGEIEVFEGRYLDYLQTEGLKPVASPLVPAAATQGMAAIGNDPNLIERPQVSNQGIIHAPALQRFAQRIVDDLVSHWPGDRPSITVYVVDGGSFNAKACGSHEKAYPRYSGATRFSDVARSS